MVKIVLPNREAFQEIEERLNNAVQDYVDKPNAQLSGSQRKVIRGKLSQIATVFLQKVKRNTRLEDEDWSDDEEPEAKRAKTERVEPENKQLKTSVEDLKRKVQAASKRVKEHRQTLPSQLIEATRASLAATNGTFESSLAAPEAKPLSAQKPDLSISTACREAFVDDCADMASRVAVLGEEVPQQIAKGRSSVRVCKEWMGKPLTGADAIMAEGAKAA
eukprot:CAMPEP_0173392404 /NCGR_PEP_ID=MMETSP1356-20130122/19463_1 /TAXON_ID=77927 ORGANISM="Hemiselmis virescens, Strain PCC157" /NCGR_SAMPLE_ID=MMETSP1356 /ASSEMBLY_ACC=CAM_ASM_000847 /LENGTH=218 /DNA_ID=CAMNT_0014350189 /DNA_START=21 /DNA_END=674 /DNA_ORIENTATION=+